MIFSKRHVVGDPGKQWVTLTLDDLIHLIRKDTPMTVDEFDLRHVARDLEHAYRELDAAKHTRAQPAGERVMRPRPGSQAPGNLLIISLDRDIVSRLVEYVRDAANHVDPSRIITWDGAELCRWIAWHASAIAELDFATDMLDEMVDQVRRITHWLHPAGDSIRVREAAHAVERKFTAAEAASLASAATGQAVDRKQVTYWGRSGRITPYTQPDGTSAYLLGEVIDAAKGYRDDRKKSG